ncbi:MAG: GNAT family protein [Actinomycetota bacterium]
MTELRGDRVLLRGFRPDEVSLALDRMQTIPATDLDEAAVRERRERIERSGQTIGWEILLAVEAEGRLVGDVQGRCPRFAMPRGVWELGIELWDRADRGRGIGRETVALLSSYLFGREDAIRVQVTTDVENGAMRRVLEVLGFGLEGVLRGFMPDPTGTPRDYAMYGMTRPDWKNAVRNGWMPTS